MADEPAELYVHAEETRYQCRRHEHQGDERKHLHDLVLIEVDDTEDCVLKIFKTFKTKVGMIYQRGYILKEHIEPLAVFNRIVRTFENAGNNPLLVDDVLANEHGVILELVDVDEEFLADIFSQAYLLIVLVDFF